MFEWTLEQTENSQTENSQVRKVSIHTWNQKFCHQLFLSLHDWSLMALWKKMEIFPTPSCKIEKNVLACTKRYIFVGRVGGAYNMENKDTNTKWEIVEITIGTIFFFFFVSYSLFFIQGVSKSHMKKNNPHLKCHSPPKISTWTKSLLYKTSEKWLNPPTPQNSTKTY